MLYYFLPPSFPIGPITDFVTEQFLDLSYLKASSQSNFVEKQCSAAYFQNRFNNNFVCICRITRLNAEHTDLRRR